MAARYLLGIDLGTTNSVLAYAPLDADEPDVQLLSIPQLAAAATVESRTSLPSFLYLASEHEAGQGSFDLDWADGRDFAVGQWARSQSAEVPDRTVVAAKSWLCHSRVDRRSDRSCHGLGSPDEVQVSPITGIAAIPGAPGSRTGTSAFPGAPVAEQEGGADRASFIRRQRS